MYEYIKATDDDELLQLDMVNNKKMRRNMIAEERDNMVFSDSTETELNADQEDYGNELEEMQIVSGNKEHLKKRVGELLYVYINLDTNNKKTIDLSYADIESKVMRSKLNEKKSIKILRQIKQNDPNSLALVIWVLDKLISTSLMAKKSSSPKRYLENLKLK